MTIRVALCDDHRMLRDALTAMLVAEGDIEVVGTAGDGEAILEVVRAQAPDVLVLDISMDGMGGVEVAQRLQRMNSPVKILALSAYSDRHFVQEMLKAGVAGYLTKAGATTDLIRAIRDTAAGKTYLSPDIAGVLVASIVTETPSVPQPAVLSPREHQVLCLIAEGMRSIDVAERIGIAVATVEVHRRNVMRKLDLHNIADLTRYAVRSGMTKL